MDLYVDNSSTKDESGANLIIESLTEVWHKHTLKFIFKASNNEAKYEALIAGIELCTLRGWTQSKHSLIPS